MDWLTLFGLIAVGAMILFYSLEEWSPVFILAFAAACLLASIYGFLQGAWPFGLVEGVWSVVAVRRYMRVRRRAESETRSMLQEKKADAVKRSPV